MEEQLNSVESLLALRCSTPDQIRRALLIGDAHISRGKTYGSMTGLTLMHNPAASPANAYFDGERLVLLYVHTPDQKDVTRMREELGRPENTLRSRAGKRFTHYIYNSKGLAFSVERGSDTVKLLEIFDPGMSLEEYQDTLYVRPGDFRR